jgi:hypothetical protein
MKSSEIKELLISSVNADADTSDISGKLEEEGITYDFSESFSNTIINRIFSIGLTLSSENEFVKYMKFAFYRVAITGVAAILLLLISIFLKDGSLSLNTLFGMSDSYDEGIICLLTGN